MESNYRDGPTGHKNERVCRDIYIKTEKAQEQDGFGNKMYSCYVEVVFHFVAKAILFLCFFGFDIYISLHTLSFFVFLLFLYIII